MDLVGGDPDIETVMASEIRLLADVRRRPAAVSELLHDDFHEFGSSGTVWDRASILDMLRADDAGPPEVDNVTATRLAPDVVFLTYRSRRPGRVVLRSSIWRRTRGRWTVYFHQGTPTSDENSGGTVGPDA